jgi:predicted 2-oxoglutarate/Fe(II)-dependent dioxygenase YbiX
MNRDLASYVMNLDAFIDAETCRRAVAALQSAQWRPHTYMDADGRTSSAGAQRELDVAFSGEPAVDAAILRKLVDATRFYTLKLRLPWLTAPKRHSDLRYNRYGAGQVMLEHWDHIHSLFDGTRKGVPVLSCLAALNDDFEGGEFVLWQDEVIPMRAGAVIVFPSSFLYPHRVEPVVSGVRYSCVAWAW